MNSPAATSLTITQREQDQRPVLILAGELSATTAAQFTGLATDLISKGARDIIVDAGSLALCDADGLAAFTQVGTTLRARAGRLALVALAPALREALESDGLVDTFVIAPSVPAALYAIHRDHP
jgi:anti-anti-sigma factor